jgi:hypothetical protein
MKREIVLGSIAALGLATTAMAAENLSYTYVELGYIDTEIDDLGISGDGWGIRGSYRVANAIHLFGSYADLGYDGNVDVSELRLGGGYAWPMSPKLDLVGSLAYVRMEASSSVTVPGLGRVSVSVDESGYSLGAMLRSRLTDQFEVNGGLDHVDVGSDNDTALEVGGRYFLTPAFNVGLDLRFNDDGTSYMIGGRYHFGS